ncbi:hypothetical protein A2U01_0008702 [Trifolium medium]|uniref:Uncharacterized protein n=1 Tax=Trifolium medium TaxID=97028 RepID=A0A392MKD5_9FABA|nr:hypothetical protein [Trifolium medium]
MDSEPDAALLKLQEDVAAQKVKHEALEEKVDNIDVKQNDMDSKLDAILTLLSKKP